MKQKAKGLLTLSKTDLKARVHLSSSFLRRMTFTAVFLNITWFGMRLLPEVIKPEYGAQLQQLAHFLEEQVSLWLIGYQLAVLVLMLVLAHIPWFSYFKTQSVEETVRLYYTGMLTLAAFNTVYLNRIALTMYFFGLVVPWVVAICINDPPLT